jgi:ribosome recycling factor
MTGKDGSPIEINEPPLTEEERKTRALEVAKLLKEVGAFNE